MPLKSGMFMAFLLFVFFAIQLVSATHIFGASPENIEFSTNDTLLLKEVFCNVPKNKAIKAFQELQKEKGTAGDEFTVVSSTDLPYEQEKNRSSVVMIIKGDYNNLVIHSLCLLGTHLANNPAIKEKCEQAQEEWNNTFWLWKTQWPEFKTESFKCTYYPISNYPTGNKRTTTELHCSREIKFAQKAALIEALKNI